MQNNIEINITGKDSFTAFLKSSTAQWAAEASQLGSRVGINFSDSLDRNMQAPSGWATGLAAGVGSAVGNAVLGGIQSAFNIAQGLVTSFQAGIMDAAAMQTRNVVSAASLSTRLGITRQDAAQLVEQLQIQVSRDAAALPGDQQDYLAVQQSLMPMMAANFRNIEEMTRNLNATTQLGGLLAASAGTSGGESGMALQRFLGGMGSLAELIQLNTFQNNQDFVDQLKAGLKQAGITDLDKVKEATFQQRLDALMFARERTFNEETIKGLNETLESQVASLQAQLFDPNTGTFGFMRRIAGLGDRNILEVSQDFMDRFSKFVGAAQALAARLGLAVDPMLALGRFIDWAGSIVEGLTRAMERGSGLDFSAIPAQIGNFINSLVSNISGFLQNTDWSSVGAKLAVAVGVALDFLSQTMASIDWQAVGGIAINAVRAALELLAGFLVSFDWSKLAIFVGTQALAAMELFVGQLKAAIAGLGDAFTAWFKMLGDFAGGIFRNLMNSLQSLVGLGSQAQPVPIGSTLIPENRASNLTQPLPTPATQGSRPNTTVNMNATVNATHSLSQDELRGAIRGSLNDMYSDAQRRSLGVR